MSITITLLIPIFFFSIIFYILFYHFILYISFFICVVRWIFYVFAHKVHCPKCEFFIIKKNNERMKERLLMFLHRVWLEERATVLELRIWISADSECLRTECGIEWQIGVFVLMINNLFNLKKKKIERILLLREYCKCFKYFIIYHGWWKIYFK